MFSIIWNFVVQCQYFLYKCFLNVYGKWENKAKLILFYKWYFLVQCQCIYTDLLKYVWINKTKFVLYYMTFCSSSYCICHGEIISILFNLDCGFHCHRRCLKSLDKGCVFAKQVIFHFIFYLIYLLGDSHWLFNRNSFLKRKNRMNFWSIVS